MSEPTLLIAAITLAYLIGSVPWGLILAKRRGLDIRNVGSGNIGATNVARNLGKRFGAVVLLLDAMKGALPVGIALIAELRVRTGDPFALFYVASAAILGHCFPPWLRFRGGKGVATSLGVFLVLDPLLAICGIATFAVIYLASRVASLGSILGALVIPLAAWLLQRPNDVLALCAFGAAVIVLKHHSNIRRLISRTELKV